MSSGEADAIKYVPVVGSIQFQGLKYKDRPIRPEEVHPDDRLPRFDTYTIPPEDRDIIIDALDNYLSDDPDEEIQRYNRKIEKIIKYLGG